MKYSESIYQTRRWKTREVKVGRVGIGGNNPIRLQSMVASNTRDVAATTEQIIRIAESGFDLVRLTVQGKKEAEACEKIKNLLVQKGYCIPIIADIHFYPPAALLVADFVDKVRINPGNFVDKRAQFKKVDSSEKAYAAGLDRIREAFGPLVQKCQRLGLAIRIGTNHGSLSDQVMNRYGDTPLGMVESALEFAQVSREMGYHELIFSMKASNPIVMIQAYRLLTSRMMQLGWNYPLHLGVTEAGLGEEGRVKSAIGIGSLLLDGLGDTIRVSLTEDPWLEIDPCKRLKALAETYQKKRHIPFIEQGRPMLAAERRSVRISPLLHRDGSVLVWGKETQGVKADAFFDGQVVALKGAAMPTVALERFEGKGIPYVKDGNPAVWNRLLPSSYPFLLLEMSHSPLHQGRHFFQWLRRQQIDCPVILVGVYPNISSAEVLIRASAELGALLTDGLGEGILLKTALSQEKESHLAFRILQGCRMRAIKTEFIACPSCGRTLFDLQSVTRKIQEKVAHLPGVKVAIMGCVVNGPGEMVDADFGYVGSGRGQIDLYVGKTCVERGIPYTQAVEKLVMLIKQSGRWIEPLSMAKGTCIQK